MAVQRHESSWILALIERSAHAEHVPVAGIAETDLVLEVVLVEISERLEVRVEVGQHGEFFFAEEPRRYIPL